MRLFVTGTDTGVGKTFVTAALARAARDAGSVAACKPVASGVPPGAAGEDAELLGAAAGHPPAGFARLRAPLSPHRAARLEGRTLGRDLLERIGELRADTVLVEGVGGWKVPLALDPPLWVEDLARATGGPVLVVAPDRLGALHQALVTVEAVRRAGFDVAAVVLNRGAAPADDARPHNLDDLRELLDLPVVPFPPLDPADAEGARAAGEAVLRVIVPRP